MAVNAKNVLILYVEPTPYIVGLLGYLQKLWPGKIKTLFLREKASQDWSVSLDHLSTDILPAVTRTARATIRAHVATTSYDLVHLCGWGDPLLKYGLFLASLKKIPTVVASDTQLWPLRSLWKRCVKRVSYPWMFRIPSAFLPAGIRQMDYLRSYGVSTERLTTVHMTVDVDAIISFRDKFSAERRLSWRSRVGVGNRETVFLFVGRLEPTKGISALMEAFAVLACTNPLARLLVVGDGSMREFVEEKARQCDWLIVLGRLDGEELLSAYTSADVFVLPSLFEPWGLVVNEAMAAGLPVIASNCVGCVDDLIQGRDTGMVYDCADRNGLVNALHSMSLDVDSRVRMGRNALRLISGWTLRAEAERIIAVWNRVA
jgi:glycosyltransferase involved in cell wall biosynthesis